MSPNHDGFVVCEVRVTNCNGCIRNLIRLLYDLEAIPATKKSFGKIQRMRPPEERERENWREILPTEVGGLFKSSLPTRKRLAGFFEYHPRKWVDCSSPAYKRDAPQCPC